MPVQTAQKTLSQHLWGGYKNSPVAFRYILMPSNTGGAGGFYTGIKTAHETGVYDAVWVMDDDGVPDLDCLEHLATYLDRYDYIAPMVVNETKEKMSFYYGNRSEFMAKANGGIIEDMASPFNGILYSKRLIDAIGYPNKDFFIWGDEVNYHLRAKKAGFIPITVCEAIHIHPLCRQEKAKSYKNNTVHVAKPDWKVYCALRNSVYNDFLAYSRSEAWKIVLRTFRVYAYYYLFKEKNCKHFFMMCDAMWCGMTGNFNRLSKYKK